MDDEELRRIARARVDFKHHLLIYVVIIGFLALINLLTSRQFPWFLFPAGGWGIGIVSHYVSVYRHGSMSVEREYRKLKEKEEKNKS